MRALRNFDRSADVERISNAVPNQPSRLAEIPVSIFILISNAKKATGAREKLHQENADIEHLRSKTMSTVIVHRQAKNIIIHEHRFE